MPTLLIDKKPVINIATFRIDTPQPRFQRHGFSGAPPQYEVIGHSEGRVHISGRLIGASFTSNNSYFNKPTTMLIIDDGYTYELHNAIMTQVAEEYDVYHGLFNIVCDISYESNDIVKTVPSPTQVNHIEFETVIEKKATKIKRGLVIFKR